MLEPGTICTKAQNITTTAAHTRRTRAQAAVGTPDRVSASAKAAEGGAARGGVVTGCNMGNMGMKRPGKEENNADTHR